jgi:hypothetical protein
MREHAGWWQASAARMLTHDGSKRAVDAARRYGCLGVSAMLPPKPA